MAKKAKNTAENLIEDTLPQADASEGIMIKVNTEKKLSKLEIEFNKHAQKIKDLKNQIEILPKQAQDLQAKIDKELAPIQDEIVEGRIKYVKNLEHAYLFFGLSKTDKQEALELILGETLDLINNFGRTDLIPFYDTYNEMTYEEEAKEMEEEQKKTMETMFNFMNGSAFGKGEKKSFEGKSMEEIFEELHKTSAEEEEKAKQRAWEKQERDKNKKKTNRQMEAELKKQAEDQLFNKSTRTIYTELVKELHPDKELDEHKREWKTEIMKKITTAYQDNDLYELLRLQLEYQQSKFQVQDMSEDILGFYVKVLKNQVQQLNQQIHQLMSRFHGRIVELGLGKSNQSIAQKFRREKEQLNYTLESLAYTNMQLKDKNQAKQHLKASRQKPQQFDLSDIFNNFFGR